MCGGAMAARCAILPILRADISDTKYLVVSVQRNAVYGCPISLLNDPGGATVSPASSNMVCTMSLVEVFPAEPVIPMTVSPRALSLSTTYRASFAMPSNTAATEPSVSCSVA